MDLLNICGVFDCKLKMFGDADQSSTGLCDRHRLIETVEFEILEILSQRIDIWDFSLSSQRHESSFQPCRQ